MPGALVNIPNKQARFIAGLRPQVCTCEVPEIAGPGFDGQRCRCGGLI